MSEVRECAQDGTPFIPRREHARFCCARCRMAWNREHAGVAAAPAVAIDWSVTAMTEAAGRLSAAGAWELPRLAAAVGETVWYVRNQLGRSVDPAEFAGPAAGNSGDGWVWRPLPEPGLDGLAARARQWELSRYRACQARLAGHDIIRTFARCTDFLTQAAGMAVGST